MRGESPIHNSELLLLFDELESWLSGLGLAKHDRLSWSVANVREFIRVQEKLSALGVGAAHELSAAHEEMGTERFVAYLHAISEVLEFVQICQAFGREMPEVLKPKLSRALSGPALMLNETKENADARNVTFELALAAEWRKYGFDIAVGEPDITISIRGIRFFVECKRPFREESIRANVRGANHQLAEILDKPGCESSFGVIAISGTRFLMPATHISTFSNPYGLPVVEHMEQSQVALGRQLRDLMHRNERNWLKRDFHPRVVAILFHVCPSFLVPGAAGGMSVSLMSPLGNKGPAFTCLEDALMAAYQMRGLGL